VAFTLHSVFEQRAHSVRAAITAEDVNISFVDFAPCAAWNPIGSGDIHVVTLREEWTGTVVPSKFFGALAAGRPVLFAGAAICYRDLHPTIRIRLGPFPRKYGEYCRNSH